MKGAELMQVKSTEHLNEGGRSGLWQKLFIKKGAPRPDRTLMAVTLALALFGTVMVFSAGFAYAEAKYDDGYYFIKRQAVWLVIGVAAMLLGSRLRPPCLYRLTPFIYGGSMALLILTLLIGFVGNGAQRWISIGPLTLQPSEIAKLALVMMLAWYFSRVGERARARGGREALIWGTLLPIGIMLLPILLVMLQRHLSCIVIMGCIGLLVIALGGIDLRYIATFIGAGGAGVVAFALLTDYTKDRITVWLDPEKYKLTGGWQTLQGLMAIGSGGLFGKGLGMGELKYCYVSEPANDMIFAIVCEELGLIGAIGVLGLFALLIWRGVRIGLRTEDTYSRLLCLGICIQIAVQALLNVAVVTNTVPNTGISLPFFSYGGSSLIMLMLEVGVMLSISRDALIDK